MKHRMTILLNLIFIVVLTACVGIAPTAGTTTETDSDGPCESGFRLFEHEKLVGDPVCVPENPQRIVTLGAFSVETLLALGGEPVGAQGRHITDRSRDFPETASLFANTTDIGNPPNPETILTLAPDLIIGVDAVVEEIADQLPQIGPTVLFDFDSSAQWKEATVFFADAVAQVEAGEQLFNSYETKIAALQDALAENSDDPTTSILRVRPDRIQIYLPASFPGSVVSDIGLRRPDNQAVDGFTTNISMEDLPSADAEVMFLWTFGSNQDIRDQNSDALSSLLDEPLWQALDVVQTERVYEFPGYWIGSGILAANAIVDDISMALVGETFAASTASTMADSDACEAGFRLFDHELLETDPVCIPENPERIVALAPAPFEIMLAIGAETPVGAIGYLESIYQRNFPYTNDSAANVEFVGFPANLEAVVALQPDLIVQSPFGQEDIELVQQIAPTVILPLLPNVRWEENMRFTGDLLNRSDEVEVLIAQYNERVETLRDLIGNPSEIEISVVRYFDNSGASGLQIQLANAFSTDMLADVGFVRPESQAYSAEEATEVYGHAVAATISLEELPLIDGQYLFAWSQAPNAEGDAANEGAWTALSDDPLWATLEAVKNEQTYQVGGHWVGWGFHAAHEVAYATSIRAVRFPGEWA
ncbi:MAG: iron-siderophore ABC transporter substrate-binding protein [Chloroflexota bacterium]